ncbi:MAG: Hsp70 family protein [Proteobacteria bacterium]|nr:Hsp70 family protein [Pseudomonadota bacterium]
MKDYGDKISAADKENVEKKIAELKEAIKGSDVEKIKKATEEVTQAAHKLAEAVYKAQSEQQQAAAAGQQAQQQQTQQSVHKYASFFNLAYPVFIVFK